MKDTLFDLPVQKSPRLLWLEAHRVTTKHWPGVSFGDEDEFGNEMFPWTAFVGGVDDLHIFVGAGDTEQDAIVDLAVKKGWKLWNE